MAEWFGLDRFGLVWLLMLQSVKEVLLSIHTKFEFNRIRSGSKLVWFGLDWFGLAWLLMLQSVKEVLLSILAL